jgi:hypothetical protein
MGAFSPTKPACATLRGASGRPLKDKFDARLCRSYCTPGMKDGSFALRVCATRVVASESSSGVLILIGILGLIEAGCGPPR